MNPQQDDWGLEDLNQDVHLIGDVTLRQFPWLLLSALGGAALAALPVPWPLAQLVLFLVPPALTLAYFQVGGPVWAARIRAYRARGLGVRRGRPYPVPAPAAGILRETVSPLADLGGGRWTAAAVIEPPPYELADPDERGRRIAAWAAMLNAAAAHTVQVDVYAAHHPDADWAALLAAADAAPGAPERLRRMASMRLRHFAAVAAAQGYRPVVVVRLSAGAPTALDAWQRFRACEAAMQGAGLAWSWASGAWLWSEALAWADPGAAVRRMVDRVEKRLVELDRDGAEGERGDVG